MNASLYCSNLLAGDATLLSYPATNEFSESSSETGETLVNFSRCWILDSDWHSSKCTYVVDTDVVYRKSSGFKLISWPKITRVQIQRGLKSRLYYSRLYECGWVSWPRFNSRSGLYSWKYGMCPHDCSGMLTLTLSPSCDFCGSSTQMKKPFCLISKRESYNFSYRMFSLCGVCAYKWTWCAVIEYRQPRSSL